MALQFSEPGLQVGPKSKNSVHFEPVIVKMFPMKQDGLVFMSNLYKYTTDAKKS